MEAYFQEPSADIIILLLHLFIFGEYVTSPRPVSPTCTYNFCVLNNKVGLPPSPPLNTYRFSHTQVSAFSMYLLAICGHISFLHMESKKKKKKKKQFAISYIALTQWEDQSSIQCSATFLMFCILLKVLGVPEALRIPLDLSVKGKDFVATK